MWAKVIVIVATYRRVVTAALGLTMITLYSLNCALKSQVSECRAIYSKIELVGPDPCEKKLHGFYFYCSCEGTKPFDQPSGLCWEASPVLVPEV